MQKIKSKKQNTQKLLAALVMGMNLVNTVTPAAAAMQNMPEQMEALPALPKNEAQPLEYTVLPQALQCVESIVFGKAEAKDYPAGNLNELGIGDKMTVSAGQIGSVNINSGGTQTIFNGGTGFIDINRSYYVDYKNYTSGVQVISSGGTGFINNNNGYYAEQTISSGGIGIVSNMNYKNVYQRVKDKGVGSVVTMKEGIQTIGSVGTGFVSELVEYGVQEVSGGTAIMSALTGSGTQEIEGGGTGLISALVGSGRQEIGGGGTGTIIELNNPLGSQHIYGGGTSLNTTMLNGKITLYSDQESLINATVHGGTVFLTAYSYRIGGTFNYKFGGDFTFDGGTVEITKDSLNDKLSIYHTLTIENFKKGGGDFAMKTDLESEKDSDKLIINKADAGTSYIKVVDKSLNGTKPVSKNKKLLLVTVKDGKADFAGKELNTGGLWSVIPTIERGDQVKDSNGKVIGTDKEWYLTNITQDVNRDTKVLLESSDNAYALWRNTNDSLRKRLGELRLRSKAADSGGIWARYNGGKFASDSFSGSYNMYQLGYDKADNAKSTYGFALEKGSGKGSYSFGSSKDKLFAGSLYGVWTGEDGSYTDVTAKIGQFSSDVKSHGDYPDKADYRNRAYSLSVEYGKTIELSKGAGTFIEPQVQFIAGHMASTEYTTDRGNRVYLGNVNSYIGRLGFVLGQKAEDGNEVYLKVSALREFGGSRDVSMLSAGDKLDISKDYKDTWFELGLGTNIKLSKAGYFYGDVERSFGAEIKKKWQINAGMRWSF